MPSEDELYDRLKEHDESLEIFRGLLDKVNQRLADINQRFADINVKVRRLTEANVSKTEMHDKSTTIIDKLADGILSLEARVGQVTGWTQGIDENILDLNARVAELLERIERKGGGGGLQLEDRLRLMRKEIEALQSQQREFDQGSAIKGVLNFKGSIPDAKLDSFRRHWYAMINAAGGGQQKLSEQVLERISCTQADMHDLKTLLRDGDTLDDIRTAIQTNVATLNALAERITDLEETLAEVAKIRTTSADPKWPRTPFDPDERVHLLEFQPIMGLFRPQNWTIKDFIGFVQVVSCHPAEAHVRRIERRQRGRTLVTISGSCLDDDRMRPTSAKRPFLLLGERAAAVGMIFERISDERVSLELTEIRFHGVERKVPLCQD
jgi:hypothetical protein